MGHKQKQRDNKSSVLNIGAFTVFFIGTVAFMVGLVYKYDDLERHPQKKAPWEYLFRVIPFLYIILGFLQAYVGYNNMQLSKKYTPFMYEKEKVRTIIKITTLFIIFFS